MKESSGVFERTLVICALCLGLVGAAYADGHLTVNGVISSKEGGFEFPDGTVQASAAASCLPKVRFHTLRTPVDTGGPSEEVVLTASETVQWVSSHWSQAAQEMSAVFFYDDDFQFAYPFTIRLDVQPAFFKGPLTFWIDKENGSIAVGVATFRITEECP